MKKTKTTTIEIVQNTNTQRILFRVLVSSIIVLSVVYVYLIGSITFNVIARKSLENTARSLSSQISQLELNYLSDANKIDKNYATSLGYVDVNHNIFATRESNRVAIR